MIDRDAFNWSDEENLVVRSHDALACHPNQYGDAVLRKERSWDEDSDAVIVIPSDHAIAVAGAILQAAGHGDIVFYRQSSGGKYEDVDVPRLTIAEHEISDISKPRDPTAAERARRYRNKRHGDSVTRHGTERDGESLIAVTEQIEAEPLKARQ